MNADMMGVGIGSVIGSKGGTRCAVGERQPLIRRNSTSKDEVQHEQCHHKQNNYTTLNDSTLSSDYKISSLDFERVINQYTIQSIRQKCCLAATLSSAVNNEQQNEQKQEQRFVNNSNNYNHTSSQSVILRWILTIIAGLLTGLTSILLVTCTGYIVQYRARLMHNIVSSSTLSCLLCVSWVPSAAGSGIPDVKAYLNGVRSMQRLAYLPLFFVKIVGTVLSVSCLLSVGQEGPLIHIGAIIGASCSKIGGVISKLLIHWNVYQCSRMKNKNENDTNGRKKKKRGHHRGSVARRQQQHDTKHNGDNVEFLPSWSEKLLHWTMNELSIFATDAERRDLVCIGASVGFAASFGAPIGGLLFILVANAIGTFCLALKNKDLSNYSIINMGSSVQASLWNEKIVPSGNYAKLPWLVY